MIKEVDASGVAPGVVVPMVINELTPADWTRIATTEGPPLARMDQAQFERAIDPYSQFQLNVEDTNEASIELLKSLNLRFKISKISVDFPSVPIDYTKRFVDVVRRLKFSIYELGVYDTKRISNYSEPTLDFQWDSEKQFAPKYWAPWLKSDHLTRIFINCRFFQSNCEDGSFQRTNAFHIGIVPIMLKYGENERRMIAYQARCNQKDGEIAQIKK
ncbi:unnamed protein product [Caenorhabditis brenneri]